jgi:uncharacterized membrane protein
VPDRKEVDVPKATFAGHPLHPQLIPMPVALLPASFVLDLAHLRSGHQGHADAAYYTLIGALIGGGAAAVAGFADYLHIPHRSESRRMALLHGWLNAAILGATAANVLLRRRRRASRTGLVLSAAANVTALVSSWYGGHLVYAHGLRVEGVSPIADAPEAKLPFDTMIVEPFERLHQMLPPRNPAASPPSGEQTPT